MFSLVCPFIQRAPRDNFIHEEVVNLAEAAKHSQDSRIKERAEQIRLLLEFKFKFVPVDLEHTCKPLPPRSKVLGGPRKRPSLSR